MKDINTTVYKEETADLDRSIAIDRIKFVCKYLLKMKNASYISKNPEQFCTDSSRIFKRNICSLIHLGGIHYLDIKIGKNIKRKQNYRSETFMSKK